MTCENECKFCYKFAFQDTLTDDAKCQQGGGEAGVVTVSPTAEAILVSAPGVTAQQILSFVFSRKAFTNVFAQAIIDMREEHAEALFEGKLQKARWIVIRDHLSLALTVAAYVSTTVAKKALGIWKVIP